MDFDSLSDIEIRQQLTALGQNVGPVTPSTRAVHLKKLKKLMGAQEDAPLSQISSPAANSVEANHVDFYSNKPVLEVEEPLTQLRAKGITSEPPRVVIPKTTPTKTSPHSSFDDGSDSDMGGHESIRYLSPEELEMEAAYNKSMAGSAVVAHSGNVRKILLAVLVLTLVVFVFYLSDRVHRQTAGTETEEEL